MRRLFARAKRIAESPRAKEMGRKLAQEAQDPATQATISNGVRKLTKRKS